MNILVSLVFLLNSVLPFSYLDLNENLSFRNNEVTTNLQDQDSLKNTFEEKEILKDSGISKSPENLFETINQSPLIGSTQTKEELKHISSELRQLNLLIKEETNKISLSPWIELMATFVGIITLIFLYGNWRISIFLKSQEILLAYHQRYTALINKADKVDDEKKAYAYYRNFWSLNHEEFSFWRRGLIPKDTYRYWLSRRQNELDENPFSKNELPCYKCGWNEFRHAFKGSDYEKFFTRVLNKEKIECLMDSYGPTKINRIIPFISYPLQVQEQTASDDQNYNRKSLKYRICRFLRRFCKDSEDNNSNDD